MYWVIAKPDWDCEVDVFVFFIQTVHTLKTKTRLPVSRPNHFLVPVRMLQQTYP